MSIASIRFGLRSDPCRDFNCSSPNELWTMYGSNSLYDWARLARPLDELRIDGDAWICLPFNERGDLLIPATDIHW
jgi:hypothetical protein